MYMKCSIKQLQIILGHSQTVIKMVAFVSTGLNWPGVSFTDEMYDFASAITNSETLDIQKFIGCTKLVSVWLF